MHTPLTQNKKIDLHFMQCSNISANITLHANFAYSKVQPDFQCLQNGTIAKRIWKERNNPLRRRPFLLSGIESNLENIQIAYSKCDFCTIPQMRERNKWENIVIVTTTLGSFHEQINCFQHYRAQWPKQAANPFQITNKQQVLSCRNKMFTRHDNARTAFWEANPNEQFTHKKSA